VTALQLNRLLDILDRAVKVAERWADREYPQIDEASKKELGIWRAGEMQKPQTAEEYAAFEPQSSSLEKRLGYRP
jgi:hypothetical protein